jgi:putative ABC transport system permease protein
MHWQFWRRKQRNSDLDDEIARDLSLEAEERIRSGAAREEAEQASHRDFGNVTNLKEGVREVWGWMWLERLRQDVGYGWRTLLNNPLLPSWRCCRWLWALARIPPFSA